MLLTWLNRQELTTAVIPELYAWCVAVAVSMLVLYGATWLALSSPPPRVRLPYWAIPVIAAWAYLLGVAVPLWHESTQYVSDLIRLGPGQYSLPLLMVLTLLRGRFALHFSWGRSLFLSVATWCACLAAWLAAGIVGSLLNRG